MEQKKTWDLVALASIPLIMTLGNSMLIPILPTIEKKINISSFQSSMIITIYSIVSIIFIPAAGYLSDRFGRKKIIVPSLLVAGIGGAVSGFSAWKIANPYPLILIGRLIQGIGASGAFPVVIPTVGDMFKDENDISKSLGIIETSNTAGKVLSPIIGSVIALLGWFMPFWSITVFTSISLLLVFFLVKVPKSMETSEKTFGQFLHQIGSILKEKGRWLYAIFFSGWVSMFIYFSFLFFFSSALEDKYGINGLRRGFIIAIPLLALCMTSYIIGKLIGKHKKAMKWIIFIGNLAAACSLVTIGFWNSLKVIILLLSITGIGIGAVLPSMDALITEGIRKENRGTITSLYSSMRLLGVAIGPPITAVLIKSNVKTTFFILASVNLIAAIVTLIFIRPSNDKNKYTY